MSEATDRDQIAYHEAGHAVLAWTFGLVFERVSIVPTEDYSGVVMMDFSGAVMNEYDTEVLRARALTLLAGPVAVEILTGTSTDWGEWWGHPGTDIDEYKELALRLGWHEMDGGVMDLQPPMEERIAQVRGLLESRWAAVEALAGALLQDRDVSGPDAVEVMEKVGVPGPVESVWADLLEDRKTEAETRARFEAAAEQLEELR